MTFLCINGFSQTTKVQGTIFNPTGKTVYLRNYKKVDGRWQVFVLDSCVLDKGVFNMELPLDSFQRIEFYDGNEFANLYLQPGDELEMYLNTQYFDESIVFSGKGAARNNMMVSVYRANEYNNLSNASIVTKYEMSEEKDTAYFFELLERNDSLMKAFLAFEKTRFPEMTEVLSNQENAMLRSLNSRKRYYRKQLILENMNKTELGKPFMNFVGRDLDGKDAQLGDHLGQLTVLDFWATWCGPCKAQFPDLKKMEKEYEGRVTFLSVGVWCKEEEWKAMAESEGFHNNIFLEKEESEKLKEKYLLTSIPRYIILDAEGNLLNVNALRPSTGLDIQLDEFLK